ncbi:MAG: hypothetical protein Q7J35_07505 [Candidatus Methanoperedens sp.]|nr:hypothetical protein [Candidatus Methanoperedens sp.]
MKKIYIIIVIVAAILAVIFLYSSDAKKSIFTERLGDMTLTSYETGEKAGLQISGIDGLKNIPMAKAYSAVYKSKKGTMQMLVVEAPDHNTANDAFNSMNSMFGGSSGHDEHENTGNTAQTDPPHGEAGMMDENFTKAVKLDIMEFEKPEVFVVNANNRNNYYYFKMNYNMGRIYWIIFDSYDMEYQMSIVKQAVMDI